MPDEIIKELWRIKDDLAREHGYDVRALAAYLQEKERGEDSESPPSAFASAPKKPLTTVPRADREGQHIGKTWVVTLSYDHEGNDLPKVTLENIKRQSGLPEKLFHK